MSRKSQRPKSEREKLWANDVVTSFKLKDITDKIVEHTVVMFDEHGHYIGSEKQAAQHLATPKGKE